MKVCLKHATIVGAMVLAAAVPAQAEVITARVTRLYPLNTGVVNVSLASGCKVGTSYYFQFTINSDTTRAWYTTLLTAANNKTPVSIAFPGACDPAAHQPVQYIYQNY